MSYTYKRKYREGKKMLNSIMIFILDVIDLIKVVINVFG